MSTISFRKSSLFRYIAFTVLAAFVGLLPVQPSYAQVAITMPPVGQMIHVTGHFEPPQMVGLKINLKDPFSFGFIMDQGQSPLSDAVKKEEFNKIIKYFLVSLAMPNKDMWVNLSPFESKRIIPEVFGQTEMGRDLLAQDYVLKQFTASLMYPEDGLGKEFWAKVYAQAQARFGTTDINVNTFNKVWIVADHADVYQKGDTAFLVGSHLKVMLEQDFKAIEQNKEQFGNVNAVDNDSSDAKTQMASQLVREIIIPAIEKEVNEGQSFAAVRQIYNAEIMATWFKKTLRASLLGQVFADKSKIAGQMVSDPQAKEKIFQQYLLAYKRGVFNFIKQEATPDGQVIPRRYLSGGMEQVQLEKVTTIPERQAPEQLTERFSKAQAQGPEALLGEIENIIPNINNNATPMDLLGTLSNTEMSDSSRRLALDTMVARFTPNDATDIEKAQIQQLVDTVGSPHEQSPAVKQLLKKQIDQLAAVAPIFAVPIAEPTARNLMTALSPGVSAQALANLAGKLTEQTPQEQAEVDTTGKTLQAGANSGREFVANVSLVAPSAEQPQFDVVAAMSQAFDNSIAEQGDNIASQGNTTDVAGEIEAMKEKMQDLKDRLGQAIASTNLGNSIVNIRGDIQKDLGNQLPTKTPEQKDVLQFYVANINQLRQRISQSQNGNEKALTEFVQPLAATSGMNIDNVVTAIKDTYNTHMAAVEKATSLLDNVMPDVGDKNTIESVVKPLAQVIAIDGMNRLSEEAQNVVAPTSSIAPAVTPTASELIERAAPEVSPQDLAMMVEHYTQPTAPAEAVEPQIQALATRIQGLETQQGAVTDLVKTELAAVPSTQVTPTASELIERAAPEVSPQDLAMMVEHYTQPTAPAEAAEPQIQALATRIQGLETQQGTVRDLIRNELASVPSSTEPMRNPLGGINLSNEHLTMNIKVDGAGMPLPPQYQDQALMKLNGLVSIIRSITPVTQQNVPALYELAK